MLKAKVLQLQVRLQQAHVRCRRAEEVPCANQKKLAKLDEVVAQRDGARELLRCSKPAHRVHSAVRSVDKRALP